MEKCPGSATGALPLRGLLADGDVAAEEWGVGTRLWQTLARAGVIATKRSRKDSVQSCSGTSIAEMSVSATSAVIYSGRVAKSAFPVISVGSLNSYVLARMDEWINPSGSASTSMKS